MDTNNLPADGIEIRFDLCITDHVTGQRASLKVEIGPGDARGYLVHDVNENCDPLPNAAVAEVWERGRVRELLAFHLEMFRPFLDGDPESSAEFMFEQCERGILLIDGVA